MLITINERQKKVFTNNRGVKIYEFKTEHSFAKAAASRQKPVTQFGIDGNPIKSFISIKEASLKTSIDKSNIIRAINQKKMVSAGGFLWKYDVIKQRIETTFYEKFRNRV
jgi:hypothetical protein